MKKPGRQNAQALMIAAPSASELLKQLSDGNDDVR